MGWATSLRVFTTKYFQLFHMTFYWNDYEMNLGVSTLKKAVTAALLFPEHYIYMWTKFANTATCYKVIPTGSLLIKDI